MGCVAVRTFVYHIWFYFSSVSHFSVCSVLLAFIERCSSAYPLRCNRCALYLFRFIAFIRIIGHFGFHSAIFPFKYVISIAIGPTGRFLSGYLLNVVGISSCCFCCSICFLSIILKYIQC